MRAHAAAPRLPRSPRKRSKATSIRSRFWPRFPKSFADEEHKLALAYHLEGDLTRAERGYRASLALDPRAPAPRRNLALLLEARGEPAAAEWHALVFWASVRGDAGEAANARHHLNLP